MVHLSSMPRAVLRATPFAFAVRTFFTVRAATTAFASKDIYLCLYVPHYFGRKLTFYYLLRNSLRRLIANIIGAIRPMAVSPMWCGDSAVAPHSRIVTVASTVFTSFVSLMSTDATSAPTDLDASYATNGRYEYTIGTGLSSINATSLQPDGATVHVGSCTTSATGSRPCIFRLSSNGAFDNGFGTGAVGESRSLSGMASVFTIAVDSQGRVVTVGECSNAVGSITAMCAQRRLSDGTLDSTFAGGTVALLEQAPGSYATSMLIDSSDRVVMGGRCEEKVWCVARLTTGGELDTAFANGAGIARLTWPGLIQTSSEINVLVANVDGSYIAVGRCRDNAGGIRACVASINAGGSVFSPFGSGTFWMGRESSRVASAGFQASGKLVLVGSCNDASANDICLIRLIPGGSIDTSFGNAGYVRTLVGLSSGARAGAIQDDGRIVVVGRCSGKACAVRYDINGALDRSFGVDGVFQPGGNVVEGFTTIKIDALNRLVFGGMCFAPDPVGVRQCVQRTTGGPTDYARCSLDIDGDGVIASEVDLALLLRSTMGFSEDAVTEGLSFATHARRKDAPGIRRFLSTHCTLRLQ
jgi:uncharacterized delta-60 repeat protein